VREIQKRYRWVSQPSMAHHAPLAVVLQASSSISAEPSPIRTVTVGFGFAPNLSADAQRTGARDLRAWYTDLSAPYRRSGITPCPEGLSRNYGTFLRSAQEEQEQVNTCTHPWPLAVHRETEAHEEWQLAGADGSLILQTSRVEARIMLSCRTCANVAPTAEREQRYATPEGLPHPGQSKRMPERACAAGTAHMLVFDLRYALCLPWWRRKLPTGSDDLVAWASKRGKSTIAFPSGLLLSSWCKTHSS